MEIQFDFLLRMAFIVDKLYQQLLRPPLNKRALGTKEIPTNKVMLTKEEFASQNL